MSLPLQTTVPLTFAILAAGATAHCQQPCTERGDRQQVREIDLHTAYLDAPIGRARQITIIGALAGPDGGRGEIVLDPNTCRLDEYGDPAGCTRIAPARIPVQFQLLRPADPRRDQPLLYRIAGDGLPHEFFLVVPLGEAGAYRLVLRDDRQQTVRVVTLESQQQEQPVDRTPAGRPDGDGLGRAEYFALQVPGNVVIVAEGQFPTAGYKAFFRRSAIAIFPPEFSLVWIPPAGPAADVITPFRESTHFKAVEPVETVTVHDADGRHEIKVVQAPEPRSGIQ